LAIAAAATATATASCRELVGRVWVHRFLELANGVSWYLVELFGFLALDRFLCFDVHVWLLRRVRVRLGIEQFSIDDFTSRHDDHMLQRLTRCDFIANDVHQRWKTNRRVNAFRDLSISAHQHDDHQNDFGHWMKHAGIGEHFARITDRYADVT
jgi:hypothetical protein